MAGHAFAKERSSGTCAHARGRSGRERAPRRDLRPLSCSTGLCIKPESKARECARRCRERGATQEAAGNATGGEVRGALTSATGTPSGGRQCSTIMPFRGTSVPWGSCSKFFLRSEGDRKRNKHEMHFLHACMHVHLKNSGSGGVKVTYRRSARLPCGSWRFPGGSRRRTDTSNPRGRGNLPPADATR